MTEKVFNINISTDTNQNSKNALVSWVNKLLGLDMTKIEQLCTGAVYCQIIDIIYPGNVKMGKVNWKAKLEHEFVANYKILQQAFTLLKIEKYIDVVKLTKGKYQDNLEMLQWFKKFYDGKSPVISDYDPSAKRNGATLEKWDENIINRKKSPSVEKYPIQNFPSKILSKNISKFKNFKLF